MISYSNNTPYSIPIRDMNRILIADIIANVVINPNNLSRNVIEFH